MTIKKASSLIVADKVLREVRKELKTVNMGYDTLCLGTYSNGREIGYAIQVNTGAVLKQKQVAFAQARSSDDIVVYSGNAHDFSTGGQVPSEDIHSKAKHFKYDQTEEAAQFIVKYLTK